MAKAARIYIDEEHGSYTRTEFRRLRNAEKLKLMEAWFRERYENPVNETPWIEGEYVFMWGGPYDANDEIQGAFGDFVPYHLMDELITELNQESDKWAPTSKYQDNPRDEEDRDATPIEPIEMGSPEELAYRDEITTRLNRLEEIIAGRPREHGRIGHNQPPEGLEAEEDDAARIKTLTDAVASIRAELEKPVPELSEVAQKNEVVEGVAARLRAAVTRKIDVATDEFAKKLGQSAGGLPFWYGVYHATCDLAVAVHHWLNSLHFWPGLPF
jgi:hypothetical protein